METRTPRVECGGVIRPVIIAPGLECELVAAAYVGYLERFLFDAEKLFAAGLPGIRLADPKYLKVLLEDAHGPYIEVHVQVEGLPTPDIAAAAFAYSLVPNDDEPGYSEAAVNKADDDLSAAVGVHLRSLADEAGYRMRFELGEFGVVIPEAKQLESV